jgi:hypothetical protein
MASANPRTRAGGVFMGCVSWAVRSGCGHRSSFLHGALTVPGQASSVRSMNTITATVERDEHFDYSLGRSWRTGGGITASSAPRPQRFTLGEVLATHTVGEYAIVEYIPRRPANLWGENFDPAPLFHPFIARRDTNHSYRSLDAALVGCVAMKHEGPNTKADRYFMRAICADGR